MLEISVRGEEKQVCGSEGTGWNTLVFVRWHIFSVFLISR